MTVRWTLFSTHALVFLSQEMGLHFEAIFRAIETLLLLERMLSLFLSFCAATNFTRSAKPTFCSEEKEYLMHFLIKSAGVFKLTVCLSVGH